MGNWLEKFTKPIYVQRAAEIQRRLAAERLQAERSRQQEEEKSRAINQARDNERRAQGILNGFVPRFGVKNLLNDVKNDVWYRGKVEEERSGRSRKIQLLYRYKNSESYIIYSGTEGNPSYRSRPIDRVAYVGIDFMLSEDFRSYTASLLSSELQSRPLNGQTFDEIKSSIMTALGEDTQYRILNNKLPSSLM